MHVQGSSAWDVSGIVTMSLNPEETFIGRALDDKITASNTCKTRPKKVGKDVIQTFLEQNSDVRVNTNDILGTYF